MNETAREIALAAWTGALAIAVVAGSIMVLVIVGRPLLMPIYAAVTQLLSLSVRQLLTIAAIAVAFLSVATVVGFAIRMRMPENKEVADDK